MIKFGARRATLLALLVLSFAAQGCLLIEPVEFNSGETYFGEQDATDTGFTDTDFGEPDATEFTDTEFTDTESADVDLDADTESADAGECQAYSGSFTLNTPAGPFDDELGVSGTKVYVISLTEGRTVSITMTAISSGLDPVLSLIDGLSCQSVAHNDDFAAPILDSRLNYTPVTTGTYYLIAEALGGGAGTYTLTVD